ncbi:2-thiouracil desulfurase family protein [Geotalea toluenoxydans]
MELEDRRPENKLKIGVSACLLGEKVRYNGGHKLDPAITGILGRLFTLVGVCPETGCGLPTPRDAMRLEGNPAEPNLMVIRTRQNLTVPMQHFCRMEVIRLTGLALSGFIFKARSPSCGLCRVEVFNEGVSAATGRGLFAEAMVRQFPLMPMEEEETLHLTAVREFFIQRVLDYHDTD